MVRCLQGAQGIREKAQAFDIIHSHAWSPTDSFDQVLNVCTFVTMSDFQQVPGFLISFLGIL
ncbi:hypothetical protein E2C01_064880 [Portunus trituberculatus]|uniref:Uncharacterized protein n=1 Tax=Portunus trituberculatus TaxID=210409 RepID=A0A5B7HL18_PORTR|nr:hypothetical protein [Portunus trituberculatus]